jgi:chromosome segregation ATPase
MADERHPMDLYASTMGPAGPRNRKRIQPGDRLADGTIYSGEAKLEALKKTAAALDQQIQQLMTQLAEVEKGIKALEPKPAAKKKEKEASLPGENKVTDGDPIAND